LAVTKVVPNTSLARLTKPRLPSGLLCVAVLTVVLDKQSLVARHFQDFC
jgi:hypothetical protein